MLDIDWCPHNDHVIASGSEDCTVMVSGRRQHAGNQTDPLRLPFEKGFGRAELVGLVLLVAPNPCYDFKRQTGLGQRCSVGLPARSREWMSQVDVVTALSGQRGVLSAFRIALASEDRGLAALLLFSVFDVRCNFFFKGEETCLPLLGRAQAQSAVS